MKKLFFTSHRNHQNITQAIFKLTNRISSWQLSISLHFSLSKPNHKCIGKISFPLSYSMRISIFHYIFPAQALSTLNLAFQEIERKQFFIFSFLISATLNCNIGSRKTIKDLLQTWLVSERKFHKFFFFYDSVDV